MNDKEPSRSPAGKVSQTATGGTSLGGVNELGFRNIRRTHVTNMQFVKFHMSTLPQDIEETDEAILGGKNDWNLPVLFNSQSIALRNLAAIETYFGDQSVESIRTHVRDSTTAIANLFRLTGAPSETVTFTWRGKTREVAAQGHMDLQSGLQLELGILTALIAGDKADRDFLSQLPRDRYEHPEVQLIEATYAMLRTYQYCMRCDYPVAAESLIELKSLATEAALGKSYSAFKKSAQPVIDALDAVVQMRSDMLHDALLRVLDLHKKTFDTDKNSKRNAPEGFVSITALGLMRLALERGIDINIENQYLPLDLLGSPE